MPQPPQLLARACAAKLPRLDVDRLPAARGLVAPDEVDEVLLRVVQLRVLGLERIAERGRGLVGDEAGVDPDVGLVRAVDHPFRPVFES